jgi:threonylcarbamoyladenosine tRNA methylthiotransferase MtaB
MNKTGRISFFIKALGCKISQYDAERLSEKLKSIGLEIDTKQPSVYILHGCSVTGRASQKARQILRSVRRRLPDCKIVLSGCEARFRVLKKRSTEDNEYDWLLPDTEQIEALIEMIQVLFPGFNAEPEKIPAQKIHSANTRAYLKVQDGCTQFCSYCIIAHLRGKEWSRPIEDAAIEAQELVAQGHREIVLTGIHLGHFKPALTKLLKRLERINGLERIRLGSIESVEVDDELINWAGNSSKFCHHFHLPLQSGCNKILKAMNRPYTVEDFRKVVENIRKLMPLAAITTDLIVGFPGESDEDFNQTVEFLKQIEFARIHIFRYSPRDGTPAAVMPGQLPNRVKIERSHMAEEIWHNSAAKYRNKFIGKTVEALWEKSDDEFIHGTTAEYLTCFASINSGFLLNSSARVKVIENHDESDSVKVEPAS